MSKAPTANNTVPATIATRTDSLTPLLAAWEKQNKGVKWSTLLQRALKKELQPFAGKRYAHLLEN